METSRDVDGHIGSDRVDAVPSLEQESFVQFIEGFPCEWGRCPGRLITRDIDAATVVTCSCCEWLYYRVDD